MKKGLETGRIKRRIYLLKFGLFGRNGNVGVMLFLFLLLSIIRLYAQENERLITGTVVFTVTGEPIPGANIFIKGTTKISYEGNYGIQQLPKFVDVLNLREYAQFLNERQEILGWGSKPEFADPSVLGEGTNWQKEMFRPAPQQSHNLTLTGVNENTNFMLSGGILDQDGIAIGSNFKRYSFRLNWEII
jgi:hypothetical protein